MGLTHGQFVIINRLFFFYVHVQRFLVAAILWEWKTKKFPVAELSHHPGIPHTLGYSPPKDD